MESRVRVFVSIHSRGDNAMKALQIILALTATLVIGRATAAPVEPAFDIDIVLSAELQQKLGAVDRVEKIFEKRFRAHRSILLNRFVSLGIFDHSRFGKVAWTNETLIEQADEYGLVPLLHAMMVENLRRAAPADFQGRIRLTLSDLSVPGHSVIALHSAPSNWARGTIEVLDPISGERVESHRVSANLIRVFSVNHSYQGPNFPFIASDASERIGPTLSYFVKKSLSKIVSNRDALAGPVLVSQ